MSTVGMGEFRSRLRAVPPAQVQYDNIPTSEGHILNYTLERIRPEGNISNYSFEGNNSIVFVIESASHLLDCGKSYFKYRVILRDNGSNKSTANKTWGGKSPQDRTYLSEGPMSIFRQMYTTVAGTVVEDFRRVNLCHSIVEDATVDQGYRETVGLIENMGNLLRRQSFYYQWNTDSNNNKQIKLDEENTIKARTAADQATQSQISSVSTGYFKSSAVFSYGPGYKLQTENGVGKGTIQPSDEDLRGDVSSGMIYQKNHGQVIQCNPISGLLQHRKALPVPVMGPIRVELVLENPNTCMISGATDADLYYEVSDAEFIAKWVEPDYDLMRTIVAQVKRPGGILLPYNTFIHNQATLGTSDRAVSVRLYSGPARCKGSFTTMHRTDQLTNKQRDYLKNYPFAVYSGDYKGTLIEAYREDARITESSYPLSLNWRVGAQTYPRQPITFKSMDQDSLRAFNTMGVIPDVGYAFTEYLKTFGLFKDRTIQPRIQLENYGSICMQGARPSKAIGNVTTETSGYILEFEELSDYHNWGVYGVDIWPDHFYTDPNEKFAWDDGTAAEPNDPLARGYVKTGSNAAGEAHYSYTLNANRRQNPSWIRPRRRPADLAIRKGKFVAAMNYEADSSNPHFGGVNLGPGAELNLDITFNQACKQPLSLHTFCHVDQVLNIRPNGAHQVLK